MSVDDGELGEIGGGMVGDAEDQEGAVVQGNDAGAAVVVRGGQDVGSDFAGGLLRRNTREDGGEAVRSELFVGGIFGFENAIGSEKNGVAGQEIESDFVVLRVRKQAERNACDANGLDGAVAGEE